MNADPQSARPAAPFLSRDPIEGGVGSDCIYPLDPLNKYDPDGRAAFAIPALLVSILLNVAAVVVVASAVAVVFLVVVAVQDWVRTVVAPAVVRAVNDAIVYFAKKSNGPAQNGSKGENNVNPHTTKKNGNAGSDKHTRRDGYGGGPKPNMRPKANQPKPKGANKPRKMQ